MDINTNILVLSHIDKFYDNFFDVSKFNIKTSSPDLNNKRKFEYINKEMVNYKKYAITKIDKIDIYDDLSYCIKINDIKKYTKNIDISSHNKEIIYEIKFKNYLFYTPNIISAILYVISNEIENYDISPLLYIE